MTEKCDIEKSEDRIDTEQLRNHWTRPLGPLGYYWFLTFEDCLELADLAKECQGSIDFPYYDLTPEGRLHLTLGKIAHHSEINSHQVSAIAESATQICSGIAPFEVSVECLSSVRSAVAFDVNPAGAVEGLRNRLNSVTENFIMNGGTPGSNPHPPHITIAYANADGVPAQRSVQAVDKINKAIKGISIVIDRVSLVLLIREPHHYSWEVISQIPLNGSDERRVSSLDSACYRMK